MSTGNTSSITAAIVTMSGGREQRAGDRAPGCRQDQQDGGLIHGGA